MAQWHKRKDIEMSEPRRVVAVASAGGHWVQLRRLRPSWDGCVVTYVTTDADLETEILADGATSSQPRPNFKVVSDGNRRQKMRLLWSIFEFIIILLQVRPHIIITTGAAPGYLALRIGAMFGARTIWVDSIANVEELSMSGRKIARHADLVLTQWPHLAEVTDAQYVGAVL